MNYSYPSAPTPPRHEHEWSRWEPQTDRNGIVTSERQCLYCAVHQYSIPGTKTGRVYDVSRIYNSRAQAKAAVKKATAPAPHPTPETAKDRGGIRYYDHATDTVTMGDGSQASVESLRHENPGINWDTMSRALQALQELPSLVSHDQGSIDARWVGLGSSVSGNHTMPIDDAIGQGIISGVELKDIIRRNQPRPTSSDAMKIILAEVRNSDDPSKAVGEWLTKLTRGLTAILDEMEEER